MKDLARRYYVLTESTAGRRRLVTIALCGAVCINLVASALSMTPGYRADALALYAFGGGMLVACVVFMLLNRKVS